MDARDRYPLFFSRLDKGRLVRCAKEDAARIGAWRALCPAHEDRSPSLSVWIGRDGRLMFGCHSGCSKRSILAALGLGWGDCFPPKERDGYRGCRAVTIERRHEYVDADGVVSYRKCIVREPDGSKRAFYQRWDRQGGAWRSGMGDTPRLLYMLPELLASSPRLVIVTEGERKAEMLAALGFVSTTAGGSEDWRPEFAPVLAGRPVLVMPDNNAAGQRYAAAVVGSLVCAGCRSLRLYRWPKNTPDGWDIGDEIEACRRGGDGVQSLAEMAREMVIGSTHWRAA